MAWTQADLDALRAARKSGAKSLRLPNGHTIIMDEADRLDALERRMERALSAQRPSSHRLIFDRGL